MTGRVSSGKIILCMFIGIIGCVLMAGSDWLMIYGDAVFEGALPWLTSGAAEIPPFRNMLAMILSFPAVMLYIVALMAVKNMIVNEFDRKIYVQLTVAGLTPWLCVHLFYVMILYLFGFLNQAGEKDLAFKSCEALFNQFSWIIPVSEVVMLLPFVYLFYIFITEKSIFGRAMSINNPIIIYLLLKFATFFIKSGPFKLAFTNGLMSESMAVWFLIFIFSLWRSSNYRSIF